MTSYHFSSSHCVWGFTKLCYMLVRIILVSLTGMLMMSSEAKADGGDIGVSFSFWIRSLVFLMLKACGSGYGYFIKLEYNLSMVK